MSATKPQPRMVTCHHCPQEMPAHLAHRKIVFDREGKRVVNVCFEHRVR
jgi:hypothetical protein